MSKKIDTNFSYTTTTTTTTTGDGPEWFYEGRYYFRMWTIGKFICDALPSCQIDIW